MTDWCIKISHLNACKWWLLRHVSHLDNARLIDLWLIKLTREQLTLAQNIMIIHHISSYWQPVREPLDMRENSPTDARSRAIYTYDIQAGNFHVNPIIRPTDERRNLGFTCESRSPSHLLANNPVFIHQMIFHCSGLCSQIIICICWRGNLSRKPNCGLGMRTGM